MNEQPKIDFLVLDVDGTLTDGGIYISDSGNEFKKFHTKDGWGIRQLTKRNFPVAILTHSINQKLIAHRAEMLSIETWYAGTKSKIDVINQWSEEMNIPLENIAFIGDDNNDISAMEAVGFSACPADASADVKKIASTTLEKEGGRGCVREFIEKFLL